MKKLFSTGIFVITILFASTNTFAQKPAINTKGIKIGTIKESIDTSIRVNPALAYLSLEILDITGATMAEILKGAESFVVTDGKGKTIAMKDKILHKVKADVGGTEVDYTVKIPMRLKTETGPRVVYFKWLGPDKNKLIEVTATR